jgi:hypothetical protein
LAAKLAKSVNISKRKIYFAKIPYGYHKTENLMLSLNPLKKMQNTSPKRSYRPKLLHIVIKVENSLCLSHFC